MVRTPLPLDIQNHARYTRILQRDGLILSSRSREVAVPVWRRRQLRVVAACGAVVVCVSACLVFRIDPAASSCFGRALVEPFNLGRAASGPPGTSGEVGAPSGAIVPAPGGTLMKPARRSNPRTLDQLYWPMDSVGSIHDDIDVRILGYRRGRFVVAFQYSYDHVMMLVNGTTRFAPYKPKNKKKNYREALHRYGDRGCKYADFPLPAVPCEVTVVAYLNGEIVQTLTEWVTEEDFPTSAVWNEKFMRKSMPMPRKEVLGMTLKEQKEGLFVDYPNKRSFPTLLPWQQPPGQPRLEAGDPRLNVP